MKSEWYYGQSGQQLGPVSLEQLKQLVSNRQLQPTDLVWKAEMTGWVPAQEVEGLFKAPASPPVSPPPPPNSSSTALAHFKTWLWSNARLKNKGQGRPAGGDETATSKGAAIVREVGLAQRHLLWALLLLIVMTIMAEIVFYFFPLVFLAVPYQWYSVYRLAKALRFTGPLTLFCLILQLIPYFFISIFCLAFMNQKATKQLREAGVPVGFLGPKLADLPS